MKTLRRLILSVAIASCILLSSFIGLYAYVRYSVSSYIYEHTAELPSRSTALVLGAQVSQNQFPSRALAYRLTTAIDLFRENKVRTLLMSGDGRSQYYDEVTVMENYALEAGISQEKIEIDPQGLRTYSSCYRAKETGYNSIVIVTQKEHLIRAVYTCRALGVDAVGMVAPEFASTDLHNEAFRNYFFREKAALLLAWLDVNIIHPAP